MLVLGGVSLACAQSNKNNDGSLSVKKAMFPDFERDEAKFQARFKAQSAAKPAETKLRSSKEVRSQLFQGNGPARTVNASAARKSSSVKSENIKLSSAKSAAEMAEAEKTQAEKFKKIVPPNLEQKPQN